MQQAFSLVRTCVAAILLVSAQTFPAHAQTQTQTPARVGSASLPSLGDNSELSAAAERRIGDRIAASIYRDPDQVDDPVLVDYLQSIWQPLMAAARARGELNAELQERFAWQVFLVRDRTVNAFALPGGYFGVHLGLVSTVSNRDELAAVLGHEMSHVTQRHISRLLAKQAQQAPWLIGAMILGALAASKNPQAASAAIVGGQAVAAQTQLDFSRDMEREADRIGFGVMVDAGFQAKGVVSMFEKLQQASRLNDNGAFPYLRSHPLNTQRMGEAQARLQLVHGDVSGDANTGNGDAAPALFLHAMMAARARVLTEPGADVLRPLVLEANKLASTALSAASSAASLRPTDAASLAARSAGALYAGALGAAKLRDFDKAKALVGTLQALAANAVNPGIRQAVELLSLEVDLLAGKVPAAAAFVDLNQARGRADLLTKARAVLAAGRVKEVSDRLSTWTALHPQDAAAWQLLAAAYFSQDQNVRAIRADAESRVAELDYPGALDRFKAAQAMMRSQPGRADFMEGSIIDTRTRQVELLVREQALQDKVDR
ncbi:MAG: peptidase M48 [Polaromonas sp.]|nr:MAG: peptidase M48 [Polaromonas sp.]